MHHAIRTIVTAASAITATPYKIHTRIDAFKEANDETIGWRFYVPLMMN